MNANRIPFMGYEFEYTQVKNSNADIALLLSPVDPRTPVEVVKALQYSLEQIGQRRRDVANNAVDAEPLPMRSDSHDG